MSPQYMSHHEQYKAVFFDFAGTLFSDRELRGVHLAQLRFVADAVGVQLPDSELRAAYRAGMGVAYRSVASAPSYLHSDLFRAAFVAMAELLGGTLDAAAADEALQRQYAATVAGARLRADCLDTLARLRADGLYLQIVSNIDDELMHPLAERLGLRGAFDVLTSSEEAGSCKPDPAIYRYALAKVGLDPEQVLFVGDSTVHDIEGPAAAGMRTAWLVADAKRGEADPRPDYVIETLGQLVEITAKAAIVKTA
jgi:putative hydrolase of the HAD superfamily